MSSPVAAGTRERVISEASSSTGDDLPVLSTLADLVELVEGQSDLYVRWSKGPDVDTGTVSRDELTGVELPGLAANPLAVEAWWGDRPTRTWTARRIYDYRHLGEKRGPGVRPWLLVGRELGRGPDNEPIVECLHPVAWISDGVVNEATAEVERQRGEWGPLERTPNREEG